MKLKHIKDGMKNKVKACVKSPYNNNRKLHKTAREKYIEGIKEYKESLKDFYDFRGCNKDSLIKLKEKYKSIYGKYPSKDMSTILLRKLVNASKGCK